MIWDSFLRFLTDLAWFMGVWLALVIAFRIFRAVGRRVSRSRLAWRIRLRRERRRRAAAPEPHTPARPPTPPPPTPPVWSASLVVRTRDGRLAPSVQLRGPAFPGPARVLLTVIDDDPRRHLVSEREVSDSDIGTEVGLPPFPPPDGHSVDQILGWVWHLVLEVGAEERVLCVERLRPITGLNREAELGVGW